MDKEFVNELRNRKELQGIEIEDHICEHNGGKCVDGSIQDIISLTNEAIASKGFYCCSSANYRVMCDDYKREDYDGYTYKEIIIIKDYAIIKVPCKE